ncbi:NADH-quinone oxidoreductase subunit I [Desulfurococcaceae archaeon AG1]|jgi:NADH-quinone oxidoreductase subunit I|nr:NADH-quinone oxidoreductase subunit I [Desulfurococcaceae archaeon AG1]
MGVEVDFEKISEEISTSIENLAPEKKRFYKVTTPSLGPSVVRNIEAITTGLKYVIKPMRITIDYPRQVLEQPPWYRGMFRLLENVCIGCSLCDIICPSDAIRMVLNPEKKKRPVINWGRCIFCYYCVDICPVEAFDTTTIHDMAFDKYEDMLTNLEEFTKDPREKDPSKGAMRMRIKFDEKRGFVYEPTGKKNGGG